MLDQAQPRQAADSKFTGLDETIEAFEACWSLHGIADILEYLPPLEHPQYAPLTLELICIDLERRWNGGIAKPIDEYCFEHAEFLKDPRMLERVAFEEYRLRRQAGDRVAPEDYARTLHVRTDHWPTSEGSAEHDVGRQDDFSGDIVRELHRIAGVSQAFPEEGDRFLDFEIVQRLGSGNQDHVYLARHTTLANRLVVLKFTAEVWSESNRMARLQHSNVVPVYSVHQREEVQAVCMPFLGRHTLASALRTVPDSRSFTGEQFVDGIRNRPNNDSQGDQRTPHVVNDLNCYLRTLSFEQICVWITSRIAKGLAHAHDRGLLHRDLKPSNVLVTDEGQPMILDFNLSEDTERNEHESLVVGGTLPYMSPEHLQAMKSNGHVDARSDVYSLGVVLYQLLTGDFPYSVESTSMPNRIDDLARQQLSTRPAVRSANPTISVAVDSIVKRCLSADPSDRYQSASQLQDDLERQLKDLPLKHAPNRSKKELAGKWFRRHPRLTSAGAIATASALVLLLVVGSLGLYMRKVSVYRADATFRRFEQLAKTAKASMSSPSSDPESREFGLQRGMEAVTIYNMDKPHWDSSSGFSILPDGKQTTVRHSLGELHYLIAFAMHTNAAQMEDGPARSDALHAALRHADICSNLGILSSAVAFQRAGIERELGLRSASELDFSSTRIPTSGSTLERYIAAVQLIQFGEDAKAETVLKSMVRDEPKDSFGWFLLGNCHYVADRLMEAESCYGASVALWPEFHGAYFHRGVCRLKIGRMEEALRDFNKVLQLRPTQTGASVNRAIVHLQLGRFRDAADDLTVAIENGRTDSLVFVLRSKAYAAQGLVEESAADQVSAIKATPADAEGWIQRGLIRLPNDPTRALEDIEVAIKLAPRSRKALQNKAHIYAHMLHQYDEAIESLNQLLLHTPNDSMALAARGLLHARSGRRELAIKDGRAALVLNESADCLYQVARIFAQASKQHPDDADNSVRLLREAIRKNIGLATMADQDPDLSPISSRSDFGNVLDAARQLSGTMNESSAL